MARLDAFEPKIPGPSRPVVRCERCGLERRSASPHRHAIPQHRCKHGALCVDAEAMPTLACEECAEGRER